MPSLADTHPSAERVLVRLLRATPPSKKAQLLADLIATARELAMIRLRQECPDATPQELRRRLAEIVLGPDLAAKAYGPPNVKEA